MKLTPYDGFETRTQAKKVQRQLKTDKRYPVQHVRIRETVGRLKYVIWIGGKNSRYW